MKTPVNTIQIERKPIKCTRCRQRFKSTKNIPRHMKIKHSEEKAKRLQCVLCKNIYQNKGNHDAHYKKHHLTEHLMYMEPESVKIQG